MTSHDAPSKPPRDEAVLEVVFLHELRAAGATAKDHVCLRVRGPGGATFDPSRALIAAIQKTYPSAIAASECSGGGPRPVQTKAGAAALICDIGPVIWDGAEVARVEGGGASRGGAMEIREVEYRVEGQGGAFRVTADRVLRQN
ncbi:MAG: hypothetical protein H0T42_28605 [Deltaproteobacteria bacterium]|nr:hypothetical protein [Deltaproteobacteria bacterium]